MPQNVLVMCWIFVAFLLTIYALVLEKVCTPTWFSCARIFIYLYGVFPSHRISFTTADVLTQHNFWYGFLEIIACLCFIWQLCSVGLVTGLLICLRSAAKITHKAQAITKHAAKWHVCATIESFGADPETPSEGVTPNCVFPMYNGENEEYNADEADDEDEYEATKLVSPPANTISFQKRQALGETLVKSSWYFTDCEDLFSLRF